MLSAVDPAAMRLGMGVLLICFSIYNLLKPTFTPIHAAPATDGAIGVLNGLVGGLTGLGGVVITVWTQLRDWPKDVQRAVFQPIIAATMTLSAMSFAFNGAYDGDTVKIILIGLPALIAGLWVGIKFLRAARRRGFQESHPLAVVAVRLGAFDFPLFDKDALAGSRRTAYITAIRAHATARSAARSQVLSRSVRR